jgi:glutamine---fructose-6-phosphate transaminase (isomerizing)
MGYLLQEVMAQGRALRRVAEAYRDQGRPLLAEAARLASGRAVLLTGMGSSWAATLAAEAKLVGGGRLAIGVDSAEALYRWGAVLSGPEAPLAVLVSQSGESQELVRLGNRLDAPFIAITNHPGSALAHRAAVVLPLHAGEERGPTNQTFLNTIAVADLLGRVLLAEGSEEGIREMARLLEVAEFLEAASGVDHLLARGEESIGELHRHLTAGEAEEAAGPLFPWELIGRGSALAAVHQGALTLRELTGRVVAPFSGGFHRHGLVYRSSPATRAIILAAWSEEGSLLAGLARDILARGGRVAFISDFDPRIASPLFLRFAIPAVARGLFPIVGMIPIQFLGLADARARSFDPEVGVPKVTPVE